MIARIRAFLSGLSKRMKIAGGAVIIVLALGLVLVISGGGEGGVAYRLATVDRGSVVTSISSTGTLGAVVTVLVGSQVSGQIIELPVDFNSQVTAGQVIARIDPATFESRVNQATAELAVAQASVLQRTAAIARAQADVANAESQLVSAQTRVREAQNDLNRKLTLLEREFASQAQVDSARTGRDQAVAANEAAKATVEARLAQVAMAEADVATAHAQVEQRRASLANAQVDLDRSVIRSPVDGVIIERKIDIGQTVAASLQAPDLFTIAQDLKDMQVEVSVDEADIGQVEEGQRVTFNVDAFPGEKFEGTVRQVRLAPEVVQNVVTYKVIVGAQNPDQRLLPGMTANVEIIAGERNDTLRLANAALRFTPEGAEPQGPGGGQAGGGLDGALGAGGPGGGGPGGGGPGGGGPGGGRGGGRDGAGRLDALIERLTAQLELSADQQAQIREIAGGNRQRVQQLRAQGVDVSQIRERVRQMLTELIRPLLNPEQLEKYNTLTSRQSAPRRRVRVWVVGGDGKPEPVPLVVGISDNAHTEIVRGGLEEGAEVITGIDLSSDAAAPERRLRLGF